MFPTGIVVHLTSQLPESVRSTSHLPSDSNTQECNPVENVNTHHLPVTKKFQKDNYFREMKKLK
jgi:hypothetical protein